MTHSLIDVISYIAIPNHFVKLIYGSEMFIMEQFIDNYRDERLF